MKRFNIISVSTVSILLLILTQVSYGQTATVSIPDVTIESESTATVNFNLNNSIPVAGVQLEFTFDNALLTQNSLAEADLKTPRSEDMEVSANITGSTITALIYSTSGLTIDAGDGPILHIDFISSLVTTETVTTISFEEVLVADATNNPITPTFADGIVTIAIEQISSFVVDGVTTTFVGKSESFIAGGAVSNFGHDVEYHFDWGDGTNSGWGGSTQSHTWTTPGVYSVTAQARCQTHQTILSPTSGGLAVAVTEPPPPKYMLTTSSNPIEGGTVTGGGEYDEGTVANIIAFPIPGYTFANWTGDVADPNSASTTVMMNANKSVTANFAVDQPAETVSTPSKPTGPPSVEKNVSASFSTGDAISSYNDPVEYIFYWGDGTDSGWGGPTQSHTWTSPGAYSVTAQARCQTHQTILSTVSEGHAVAVTEPPPPTYTLSVSYDPEVGSVNHPPSAVYTSGDVITLTASPMAGFDFTGWGGDASGTSLTTTVTMTSNKSVTANFVVEQPPPAYTVIWDSFPAAGGSVTVTPAGPYSSGQSVTVTALTNQNYTFTAWSGDLTDITPSVTFTISKNMVIIANFAVDGGGAETINPPTAAVGPSIIEKNISASYSSSGAASSLGHPVEYQFDWGDGTNPVWGASSQSHAWTNPGTYSITVQARCQIHPEIKATAPGGYTVNVTDTPDSTFSIFWTAQPAAGGAVTVTPAGPYTSSQNVTVTALPNQDYTFTSWSGDLTDTTPSVTFNITKNMVITANFVVEQPPPDISNGAIVYSRDNEIYLSDIEGNVERRLTYSNAQNITPSISPDLNTITFSTNYGLWLMDSDGSNQRRIVERSQVSNNYIHAADWTLDGEWIYFDAVSGSSSGGIYKVRPDGSDLSLVRSGYVSAATRIRGTHGDRLIFNQRRNSLSYSQNVRITDMNGGNEEQITSGGPSESSATFGTCWSPDGSKFAYNYGHQHIYVASYPAPYNPVEIKTFSSWLGRQLAWIDNEHIIYTDSYDPQIMKINVNTQIESPL
ncbi:PKD domain-containing protein, partial [Candidatus Latescibacterota bacterium]